MKESLTKEQWHQNKERVESTLGTEALNIVSGLDDKISKENLGIQFSTTVAYEEEKSLLEKLSSYKLPSLNSLASNLDRQIKQIGRKIEQDLVTSKNLVVEQGASAYNTLKKAANSTVEQSGNFARESLGFLRYNKLAAATAAAVFFAPLPPVDLEKVQNRAYQALTSTLEKIKDNTLFEERSAGVMVDLPAYRGGAQAAVNPNRDIEEVTTPETLYPNPDGWKPVDTIKQKKTTIPNFFITNIYC